MTLILLIILYLLYLRYSRVDFYKLRKKSLFLISFILIFISGFRHEGVGNDTYAYMMHFNDVSYSWQEIITQFIPHYMTPVNGAKDPGMDVFDKTMQIIGLTDRLYLIVVSAITICTIAVFLFNYAKNWQALFLSYAFFVVILFNYIPNSALRQSLAVSCLLWAYIYLKKDNKRTFVILVLLGSTFHKSALIALALLPLFLYVSHKNIIRYSIILFVLFLALPSTIALYLSGEGTLYSEYATGGFYSQNSKPVMFILVIAIMYSLSLYLRKFNKDNQNESKLMLSGASLAFIFTPLIWADPSAIRLLAYFGLFLPILIGNNIFYKKKWRLIFAVLFIAFTINAVKTEDNYHFMWQEMKLHDRYGYVQPHTRDNIDYYKTYIV